MLTLNGSALEVTSVRVHEEDLTAYNLEIEGIHTYYAGDTPVLVHNTCGNELATSGRDLNRRLASEQQMGEAGTQIAGSGHVRAIDHIDYLTDTFGGSADDWAKMSSSTYQGADGFNFATHWYENVSNGLRVLQKTNFGGEG